MIVKELENADPESLSRIAELLKQLQTLENKPAADFFNTLDDVSADEIRSIIESEFEVIEGEW